MKLIKRNTPLDCIVNVGQCEKYYVPFVTFEDLYYYFEPTGSNTPIVNYYCCNDLMTAIPVINFEWKMSIKPNGLNYGLVKISGLEIPICNSFIVEVVIGTEKFYSWQYENLRYCDTSITTVDLIKNCKQILLDAENEDCNGVYFGMGDSYNSSGDFNLSYKHNYNVRNVSQRKILNGIEYSFNGVRSSSSKIVTQTKMIIGDIMPEWYATYIQESLAIDGGIKSVSFDLVDECCNNYLISAIYETSCNVYIGCSDNLCTACLVATFNVVNNSNGIEVVITNYQALNVYDISIDGGASYNNYNVTQSTLIAIPGGQAYNVVIRTTCADGSQSISNGTSGTTSGGGGQFNYCVNIAWFIAPTGNYAISANLQNNIGQAVLATSNLSIPITITSPSNVISNYTMNINIGSSSDIQQTGISNINGYQICSSYTGAGTIINPNICGINSCPCVNCIEILYIPIGGVPVPQFTFSLVDCNGNAVNASQNIVITWNTNVTSIENDCIILAGTSSVTVIPSNNMATSVTVLGNNVGINICL